MFFGEYGFLYMDYTGNPMVAIGLPKQTLTAPIMADLARDVLTGRYTYFTNLTTQDQKNIYVYPDANGTTFTLRTANDLVDTSNQTILGTVTCTNLNSPVTGFCRGTLTLNGVSGSGNAVCELYTGSQQHVLACAAQHPSQPSYPISFVASTSKTSLLGVTLSGTAATAAANTSTTVTATLVNRTGRPILTMGHPAASTSCPGTQDRALCAPFSATGQFAGNSSSGGPCGTTLNGFGSCTVTVTYNPTALGTTLQTYRVAYDNGTTTLNATSAIRGTAGLSSIAVTPATTSYTMGGTQQFTATATYSDSSTQNVTNAVVWSSTATGVATVDSAGMASFVGGGSTTLSATLGAISGSRTIAVIPNPTNLVATVDSSSQITLTYTSGGAPTAKYQIAYQTGATAPANCSSGTQIGHATVGSATTYAVTSLLPLTQYSFRVCALDASNNMSSGVTASATTPAAPGSLDLTFNSTGIVTTALGTGDQAYKGLVQPDGKIIAVGQATVSNNKIIGLARYNTNGSLDTSFNTTGRVTTQLSTREDAANGVTLQSDGKILVTGFTGTGSKTKAVAVVRYNTNGTLDTTFNSTGIVTFTLNGVGSDVGESIQVQSDGKIVVSGWTAKTSGSTTFNIFVARLTSAGALDTTFNTTGKLVLAIGSTDDAAQHMELDSNGKILVAGYVTGSTSGRDAMVLRLNTNGTYDTTFNSTGYAITSLSTTANDAYWGLDVQSDGKILASGFTRNGTSDWNSVIVRYNSNGSLDTGFGTNGIVNLNLGATDEQANSVMVDSNGKIVTSGYVTNGNDDFNIIRLNSNGTLDTTFNGTGYATVAISTGGDVSWGMALQSDGKIISFGYSGTTFALTRHHP